MFVWWMNLAGSTVGFTFGSLLLKRYADTNALPSLLLSFAVLAASNMLFVQVIRLGLGRGVVASSMSQIIVMAALGVVLFGERLTLGQILGVGLAALSLCLMIDPGKLGT